jgi:hypothetical protein
MPQKKPQTLAQKQRRRELWRRRHKRYQWMFDVHYHFDTDYTYRTGPRAGTVRVAYRSASIEMTSTEHDRVLNQHLAMVKFRDERSGDSSNLIIDELTEPVKLGVSVRRNGKLLADLPMFGRFDIIEGCFDVDQVLDDSFDTKQGLCWLDMLKKIYGNIPGFKKMFHEPPGPRLAHKNKIIEGHEFMELCEVLEIDDINVPVSTNILIRFAMRMRVNLQAVDINFDDIAEYHAGATDGKHPPLRFVYFNSHCYFIKDGATLQSVRYKFTKMQGAMGKNLIFGRKRGCGSIDWSRPVTVNPEYDYAKTAVGEIIIFDEDAAQVAHALGDNPDGPMGNVGNRPRTCHDMLMVYLHEHLNIIQTQGTVWKGFRCIQIYFKETDTHVIDLKNSSMSWDICKTLNIPFGGISIETLAREIFKLYDPKLDRLAEKTERSEIPKRMREEVLARDKVCKMCNSENDLQIDHIRPVALGGQNETDNLQVLCGVCNRKKSAKFDPYDELLSGFNSLTRHYFNGNHAQNMHTPVIGNPWGTVSYNCTAVDYRKFYTSGLALNEEPWTVLTTLDEWRPHTHTHFPPGWYKVSKVTHPNPEMMQMAYVFVLRGDFIFPGHVLRQLKEWGFEIEVELELLTANLLPADHFKGFIRFVFRTLGNNAKQISNYLIGQLGRSKDVQSDYHVICKPEEVFGHRARMGFGKYREIPIGNKVHFCAQRSVERLVNAAPIRFQVLMNCHLRMMRDWLESGIPLTALAAIKTDELYVDEDECPEDMALPDTEDLFDMIGTLKVSRRGVPALMFEKDAILVSSPGKPMPDNYVHKWAPEKLEWTEQKINFTPSMELANAVLERNMSGLIHARAGTGKTYFCTQFLIKRLEELKMKFKCVSYMNTAARLIGGETLHSGLHMDLSHISHLHAQSRAYKELSCLDYLIVDEISMIPSNIWDALLVIKRTFKNLKFVLLGDFNQIPPVKEEKTDFEQTAILHELADGNRLIFMICQRSDTTIFDMCTQILSGETVPVDGNGAPIRIMQRPKMCLINIVYTNALRKQINEQILKHMVLPRCTGQKLESKKFCTKIPLNAEDQRQPWTIAVGVQTMCIQSHKAAGFLNSDKFTIVSIHYDKTWKIFLKRWDQEEVLTIDALTFFMSFVPGYAFTAHKVQGATFDRPIFIHEWNRMDRKIKYVALSRVTCYENVLGVCT